MYPGIYSCLQQRLTALSIEALNSHWNPVTCITAVSVSTKCLEMHNMIIKIKNVNPVLPQSVSDVLNVDTLKRISHINI